MPLSRRELFQPVRDLGALLENLRSEHDDEPGRRGLKRIDQGVEYTAEVALVLTAIHLAFEGSQEPVLLVAAEPNERLGQKLSGLQGEIGEISEGEWGWGNLTASLRELGRGWREAYYKSRQETYWVTEERCSGIGKDRKCTTELVQKERTVYYWDEPDELVGAGVEHGTIGDWVGFGEDLEGKWRQFNQEIATAASFGQGSASYGVTTRELGQRPNQIAKGVVFGTTGGLFAFYEELLARAGGLMGEEGLEQLAETKVKRRSFLKLLALGWLGPKIVGMRQSFGEKNSQVAEETEALVTSVVRSLDADPETDFKRILGRGVNEVFGMLAGIGQQSEAGSVAGQDSTEDWQLIRPKLEQVASRARGQRESLAAWLNYDGQDFSLPEDLRKALKAVWGTREISRFVEERNRETTGETVREVLAFAGAMLGLGAGIEGVLELSDRLLEKYLESV